MSMERISRALELAVKQRESRAAEPPEPPQAVTDDSAQTATFRAPIVQLDSRTLEREHILPPNAGGEYGIAYKLLRTQVLRRLDQLKANTLAVLSPSAEAGKTLTAINLAIATTDIFDSDTMSFPLWEHNAPMFVSGHLTTFPSQWFGWSPWRGFALYLVLVGPLLTTMILSARRADRIVAPVA